MFPRGGMFVAWTNAWLDGRASLDEADVHTVADDALHRIVGLPSLIDETRDEALALSIGLSRLRGQGTTGMRLVLPIPGDALGLPGPRNFNESAIQAREAVIADGPEPLGFVPTVGSSPAGTVVRWDAFPVNPSATPPRGRVSEYERDLGDAMREATETLESLDLARDRPDLGRQLQRIDNEVRRLAFPATLGPRQRRLIVTATRLASIITWASRDDGGSLSSAEARSRGEALAPMYAAARRALSAGYSARPTDDQ